MSYLRTALVGVVMGLLLTAATVRAAPEPVTWWVADLQRPALEVPAAWAASAPAIAMCESSMNPAAVNRESGATGLFQIMEIHTRRIQRLGYTWADMLHGVPNTLVAIDLWREQSWAPWSCAKLGVT